MEKTRVKYTHISPIHPSISSTSSFYFYFKNYFSFYFHRILVKGDLRDQLQNPYVTGEENETSKFKRFDQYSQLVKVGA